MSDLQLALVIIGALIIVGVYAFNRLQERQFRRRMDSAFKERPDDVLIAPAQVQPGEPTERLEPRLHLPDAAPGPEPAPPDADRTERHAESVEPAAVNVPPDSAIDFVCHLDSVTAMAPAALAELLKSMHALGKPASLKAWSEDAAQWISLPSNTALTITRVVAALQLADRSGPINRVQLSTMRDLVREFAEQHDARCRCPDLDVAAQNAVELDRFCAQVDISIGCSVVPATGSTFPGTKVRGLLESSGFHPEPSGRFVLRAEDGGVLLWAEAIDGEPMSAERLRVAALTGLVLTLDVPRVPGKGRTFDRMIEIGRHLAHSLDGTVVDDNRAALTEAGLTLVREQVREIHDAMLARGIPAGGPLAERLFS